MPSSRLITVLGLVSVLKFTQESHVVLAEHAQVFHHIFEVGNAFNAHAKCVACVNLAVNAAKLKHVGVNHAAA